MKLRTFWTLCLWCNRPKPRYVRCNTCALHNRAWMKAARRYERKAA